MGGADVQQAGSRGLCCVIFVQLCLNVIVDRLILRSRRSLCATGTPKQSDIAAVSLPLCMH